MSTESLHSAAPDRFEYPARTYILYGGLLSIPLVDRSGMVPVQWFTLFHVGFILTNNQSWVRVKLFLLCENNVFLLGL